jgi:hypothetical protein
MLLGGGVSTSRAGEAVSGTDVRRAGEDAGAECGCCAPDCSGIWVMGSLTMFALS